MSPNLGQPSVRDMAVISELCGSASSCGQSGPKNGKISWGCFSEGVISTVLQVILMKMPKLRASRELMRTRLRDGASVLVSSISSETSFFWEENPIIALLYSAVLP